MSDEWHPFPERDLSRDDSAADRTSTSPPAATPHGEATRILPPPAGGASDAPMTRRRTGVLPAAVLVGALVVGGAAGVGGAAAYDALKPDSTTPTSHQDLSASPRSNASSADNSTRSGAIESVAAKVLPSVVQINVTGQNEAGSGSGIVLTRDGTILTNNHVVAVAGNGGSISVSFNDGTTARATVVGTDPVTDLAVIRARGVSDLTPAEIGHSSDLKVGEGVVAVGSPFGLGATVTSGIVSALDRAVSVESSDGGQGSSPFGLPGQSQSGDPTTTYPAIQTDAAINPGNSGGPLVNLAGQVVGINSSIRTTGSSGLSGDQGGSIGLGFAIPIDEVLPVVNQLRDGETPTHARLGVSVSDNTTRSSSATGALVKTVENGGAADDAGLRVGDVITKVGPTIIDGSDSLVATIRGHRPGDKVTLTILRNGDAQTLTATLGSDRNSRSS